MDGPDLIADDRVKEAERIRLDAAEMVGRIGAVEELHAERTDEVGRGLGRCMECRHVWPCRTVQLLDPSVAGSEAK